MRISAPMSAAAVVIILAALLLGTQGTRTAEAATQTLYRPWSLVAVTQSVPVEEVFSGFYTDGVFAWDADDEEFDIWRKTLPSGLNS